MRGFPGVGQPRAGQLHELFAAQTLCLTCMDQRSDRPIEVQFGEQRQNGGRVDHAGFAEQKTLRFSQIGGSDIGRRVGKIRRDDPAFAELSQIVQRTCRRHGFARRRPRSRHSTPAPCRAASPARRAHG